MIDPCCPLKEGDLAWNNPSSLVTCLSSLLLPISLPFHTAPGSFFLSAKWNVAWFINHWIKPTRSLNLFSWILFFSTMSKFFHYDINHYVITSIHTPWKIHKAVLHRHKFEVTKWSSTIYFIGSVYDGNSSL